MSLPWGYPKIVGIAAIVALLSLNSDSEYMSNLFFLLLIIIYCCVMYDVSIIFEKVWRVLRTQLNQSSVISRWREAVINVNIESSPSSVSLLNIMGRYEHKLMVEQKKKKKKPPANEIKFSGKKYD